MDLDFEAYALNPQMRLVSLSIEGIAYVFEALALWFMFKKAGEKPWKALIPIYNMYILYKICWKPGMFWATYGLIIAGVAILSFSVVTSSQNMVLVLVGEVFYLVGTLMRAVLWYNVSLSYGHGWGYFIGLFFLFPVFLLIIGLGSSRYIGNRYEQTAR